MNTVVIKLQNFVNAFPTITIIAIIIFIISSKFLRNTISHAIKSVLIWICLNFVCTSIFGITLPSIGQILEFLANLAKTYLP